MSADKQVEVVKLAPGERQEMIETLYAWDFGTQGFFGREECELIVDSLAGAVELIVFERLQDRNSSWKITVAAIKELHQDALRTAWLEGAASQAGVGGVGGEYEDQNPYPGSGVHGIEKTRYEEVPSGVRGDLAYRCIECNIPVANRRRHDAESHTRGGNYLSVRGAARALGVHENTIRNWADNGELDGSIRLPGSGYRRIPMVSVDRMKARMSDG